MSSILFELITLLYLITINKKIKITCYTMNCHFKIRVLTFLFISYKM